MEKWDPSQVEYRRHEQEPAQQEPGMIVQRDKVLCFQRVVDRAKTRRVVLETCEVTVNENKNQQRREDAKDC